MGLLRTWPRSRFRWRDGSLGQNGVGGKLLPRCCHRARPRPPVRATTFTHLKSRVRIPPPASLLRHAHISELPTIGEHAKVLQTVTEGDWPGRSGRWVAVPAAELCDDPSGPGQAVHGMRVLLERRPTLDLGVEAFEARRCRSG